MLSGCPGQEDFPSGQVTFHSHLPAGQWNKRAVCHLKDQTKTCPGQAKFESYFFQEQAGIQVFFEP